MFIAKRYTIVKIVMFLSVVVLMMRCKKNENITLEQNTGKLTLITTYHINISEPSGLTFGSDKKTLFTVSDNTNKIYKMDLKGNIIGVLPYIGNDLEGICFNSDKDEIAVVEERKRDIVILNSVGNKIASFHIDIPHTIDNKGLEGISYNSNNKMYYIVNEAKPGLLCLWNTEQGLLSKNELDFALDYSGIFVERKTSSVWIVSDESKMLYRCDYKMNVIKRYHLDKNKYEGVVIDEENSKIYLVNDATSQMSIYKLEN